MRADITNIKSDSQNRRFRTIDELDEDVASIVGERFRGWVRAESEESSSNHFGTCEPEENTDTVK